MRQRQSRSPLITGLLLASVVSFATAQDSREAVDVEMSKPMIRGAIVFKAYCSLCHGERGDGKGPGAKLHPRLPLAILPRSPEQYIEIIRDGGESVGRSAFMPPWLGELSAEQIGDVVAYLAVVRDPVRRGEAVFKSNCALCHGLKGNGDGRAGRLFHPRPADLTQSDKDDRYKTAIIRSGGAVMGRSPNMPPWEKQLTATEIQDLVHYLRTILVASSEAEVPRPGEPRKKP